MFQHCLQKCLTMGNTSSSAPGTDIKKLPPKIDSIQLGKHVYSLLYRPTYSDLQHFIEQQYQAILLPKNHKANAELFYLLACEQFGLGIASSTTPWECRYALFIKESCGITLFWNFLWKEKCQDHHTVAK